MGNSSSITEDRVSGPVGPVDYGKLHAFLARLKRYLNMWNLHSFDGHFQWWIFMINNHKVPKVQPFPLKRMHKTG